VTIADIEPATGVAELAGYALARTQRLLRHAMDDALRDLGLTTPQFAALACIAEEGTMCGADMARVNKLTPQTVHTILGNLEDHGLIERHPHPKHGTLLLVSLTQAGRERLREGMERGLAVNDRLLRDFDDSEREVFQNFLIRCQENLDDGTAVTTDCLQEL
jgi:DNA-binding MarR family transcriptional regulator